MWSGPMKGYIEAAVVIAEAEEAFTDPASSLHISLGSQSHLESLSLNVQHHIFKRPEKDNV